MELPEPSQPHREELSEAGSEQRQPQDVGKTGLTAAKRVFQRQDSGQATATANSGEEWAKPPFILFAASHEANGLQTTLTKEPVEDSNNTTLPMSLELDPLIRYLSYLQMPFSSALRPVLPLPQRFKPAKVRVSLQYAPLNLFELINKSGD